MPFFVFIGFVLLTVLFYSLLSYDVNPLVLKRLSIIVSLPGFMFVPEYLYIFYMAFFLILNANIAGSHELQFSREKNEKKNQYCQSFHFVLVILILLYWLFWVQPKLTDQFKLLPLASEQNFPKWNEVFRDLLFHADYIILSILLFIPAIYLLIVTMKNRKEKAEK